MLTRVSNFTKKCSNLVIFVTFTELQEKKVFFKIRALAFEVGDFFNTFLKFWGFEGSFSYKIISYQKTF